MRVVIVHQELAPDARADERDVEDQVAAVSEALAALGHEVRVVALPDDLSPRALLAARPDVVFNLVESVRGEGRLAHLAPELFDRLGLRYTGNGAAATLLTNSKVAVKRALREADLPTPSWFELEELSCAAVAPGRYILKSVWEHGSLGIEADAVQDVRGPADLRVALEARLPRLGGEGFAERYVHGREFNVALLARAGGVEVLPLAEIRFGFADGPHIVGYRAKWACGSDEEVATPRTFEHAAADAPLRERLRALARATWERCGLSGYARVDFRVDATGQPWIIDINTNPCLTAGAGFQAAVERAGLDMPSAVERIVAAACADPR